MAEVVDIIHIPDNRDTAMQKVWVDEFWTRHYPEIPLYRLDRVETIKDPLYNEAIERRHMETPIMLNAYIDPEPSKKILTKYGYENKRPIIITIPTLELDRKGLLSRTETFLVGDLFMFDGDPFEVRKQVRNKEGYWANTNIPFLIEFVCTRYRKGS
jgi:hypothetical protein